MCRLPSGTPLPPSARPFPNPLFHGLSPGGAHIAARRHTLQEHPYCSYHLTITPVPLGAIPVAKLNWF